jgi:hypothetical protein
MDQDLVFSQLANIDIDWNVFESEPRLSFRVSRPLVHGYRALHVLEHERHGRGRDDEGDAAVPDLASEDMRLHEFAQGPPGKQG